VTTELRTLYGASHPNIVRYHQAFFDNGAITIVMECERGQRLSWVAAMPVVHANRVPESSNRRVLFRVAQRTQCSRWCPSVPDTRDVHFVTTYMPHLLHHRL
jgi:hypothetical protein